MDDFFSNLDLETIFLINPLFKLKPEPVIIPEETEIQKAKLVVTSLKCQSMGLISNLTEIIEAIT